MLASGACLGGGAGAEPAERKWAAVVADKKVAFITGVAR
jgi:hypothetical protein